MNFETELTNGVFCIPECNICKKIVWPPAKFCNHCFGTISLKKGDFVGKIIEFSKQNEEYFCLVEFENTVRIMCKMTQTPLIDQSVKITKCGIIDGVYFFDIN